MAPKRRLFLTVAGCACLAYVGSLWNEFAYDDLHIIVANPLMRSGWWRTFMQPYWSPEFGGEMYRPLVVASFALDWLTKSTAWFHFVNVAWHAAASLVVAELAWHWAGDRPALIAGLLFAVHPVHVEAVANIVGRAELMAALFALAAAWTALERGAVGWSAAALALGLLCKENAAVAPGLIVWGWVVGVARPSRRLLIGFVASWVLIGAAYLAVRWAVLHPYEHMKSIAPVFARESPLTVRLTAVAALTDVGRLLVFPLHLRADYGPAERTAVRSLLDLRFVAGLLVLVLWAVLLLGALRRGRKVEALGLGWCAIAFLPVANLVFPTGVLVAERTLYLPSAGIVLALAAWGGRFAAVDFFLPHHRFIHIRWSVVFGVLVVLAGTRTVFRVPVWRDDVGVTESILEDSPRSYWGPARAGAHLLAARHPAQALEALQRAIDIHDRDPTLFVAAAEAAFTLGRWALADTLLDRAHRTCRRCTTMYHLQARAARARGHQVAADSILARVRRIELGR